MSSLNIPPVSMVTAMGPSDLSAHTEAGSLSQRFQALMNSVPAVELQSSTPSQPSRLEMPGMLSALAKASETVAIDMQHFEANVQNMTASELHAASSRMVMDAAMVTASTTLTTAVMRGGKSSLQTLMKNQ